MAGSISKKGRFLGFGTLTYTVLRKTSLVTSLRSIRDLPVDGSSQRSKKNT